MHTKRYVGDPTKEYLLGKNAPRRSGIARLKLHENYYSTVQLPVLWQLGISKDTQACLRGFEMGHGLPYMIVQLKLQFVAK